MDRRSFLRRLGIGAAATVTTQLWLPPVSTALAQPERRVFVPPRGGWGLQPSRPLLQVPFVDPKGGFGLMTMHADQAELFTFVWKDNAALMPRELYADFIHEVGQISAQPDAVERLHQLVADGRFSGWSLSTFRKRHGLSA